MTALEQAREALQAALTNHGVMLMSDPPRDAWKAHRVGEKISAALAAIGAALSAQEVPAGEWVMVPGEPTPEMLEAGEKAYWQKLRDVSSPTPTEFYDECGGPLGYAWIAMLTAAPAAPKQDWQPIETAPKDGTSFLGWVAAERWSSIDGGGSGRAHDESTADFCWYVPERPDETGGYFTNASGQIGDAQDITHWMPLPAAPAAPRG